MRLKAISRTATFAWDQSSSSSPLIATGAVAGALDESFSNESQLEIWAPDFGDAQSAVLGGQGSKPQGSVTVNSRFNRLAWSVSSATHGHGVLAAGMETGEINVFDPEKILAGGSLETARIFSNSKHTGPVRGLDFNPIQKNLMLSGGINAELYIFDLNNPTNPIPPGSLSTKLGEITSLQWNSTVSRIFAASSSSGYTSVWDLRTQKEIASLQYGGGAAKGMGAVGGVAGLQMGKRRGMSDVAWHPEQATQLITASEDDESPIIMLWDLRNTRAPERILTGHHKGVLSVSWCQQDADLLLSTGKDNRTLVWNPQSGEVIGELPSSSDWSFQTAWCPRNPDLLATASFDGHIGIHSLQTTHVPESSIPVLSEKATADDVFAGLSSQPVVDTSVDVLSLKQPPKWLRRPISATFGFGGLLASTANLPGATGKHQSGVVHLRKVVTEGGVVDRARHLYEAAGDKNKLEDFCNQRALGGEDGWKTLQTLFRANSTDELVHLLGFNKEQVAKQVAEATKKFAPAKEVEVPTAEAKSPDATATNETNDSADATRTLFDEDPAGTPVDQAPDFFFSMASGALRNPKLDSIVPSKAQGSESVAATAGSRAPSVRSESLKDNEFSIYPVGESEVDKLVTQALVLGDFASAVDLCLASERFADALLLAVRGGADLLQSTQKAYFARRTTSLPFLRVFQSIVTEDLDDIVQNADLTEWKAIFVVICTYAKAGDFGNLADQLGQRLHYKSQILARESDIHAKQYRQDATLCFLAARRLEKVVGIWSDELREEELSSSQTKYTAHAEALQSFMEKVSVFTAATGYVDEELNTPTQSAVAAEVGARTYRLAGLYDRYYEYADLLATQGLVDIAAKCVEKTPTDYKGSGAAGSDLEKARDRLFRAASVSEPAPRSGKFAGTAYGHAAQSRKAPAAYAPQNASVSLNTYAPASTPSAYAPASGANDPTQQAQNVSFPTPPAIRPPQATAQSAFEPNTYIPAQTAASSGFTPTGAYTSDASVYASPARYGAPPTAPAPLAPPPRAGQASQGTSVPPLPASQRRDMPGWNDAPNFSAPKRPSSAARETPKPAPIMSPFPQSQHESQGIQANIHGHTPPPPRAAPPGVLPPPPRGGPRPPSAQALTNNLGTSNVQQTNPQTPPVPSPGQTYGQPQSNAPPPPRGPPRAGPPPGAIAGPPPRALSPLGPHGRQAPPSSIRQAMQPHTPPVSHSGQFPSESAASTSMPSPAAPLQDQPASKSDPALPSSVAVQSDKPSFPAGDRSHIPPTSQSIFDTLNNELQRVKQANLPPAIKRIADDTDRRLSILFDQLNNDSISKTVLDQLSRISEAVSAKDSARALALHVELVTTATGEMSPWVPGVKQLIRLGV